MCVCMGLLYTRVWSPEATEFLPQSLFTGTFNNAGAHPPKVPANLSVSSSPELGLKGAPPRPTFYVGPGDPNFVPHSCTGSSY